MSKYRKYLEFAALLLLAGLIIWWFGRRLDWDQVKLAMRKSDWRLILVAAVIILIAYLWRAIRWQTLLKPITKSSLKEIWIATCVGFAAVLLIGRAGEVVRPVVLPMRDDRVRPAASFVTIMIERLYDIITVVMIFALNLLWLEPVEGVQANLRLLRFVGFGFLGAGLAAVALLLWFKRHSRASIAWLDRRISARSRLGTRVKHAALSTLDQMATALNILSDLKLFAVSVFWSLLLWGSVALANLLVCRAFGVSFGWSQVFFVLGWSMVGSAVPTPGGAAGAFHAATGAALVWLGVGKEQAAAIAIIIHLIDFGPAALFGLFYFLRGDINIARLRALVSVKAVEHAVEDEHVAMAESS